MDISSSFSGQNSIQFLVDQFMRFEQGPRERLLNKKSSVDSKIKVLSDLDSKLSALQNSAKRMTDEFTNYFGAKTSSVSNAEVLKATASADAALGNHVMTVERLAAFDTRVSNQFDSNANDFSAYSTDQVFEIQVAHPTDEDPDNRVNIAVTVTADEFTGTNEEVLQAIKNAVNGAMDQAVADEIITNEERVRGSVVNEVNGTSRLSFRSGNSGYTNRMDFGASSLLNDLNINNNALSSGTAGGYMFAVGTSATDSELNSKFMLDGLTFYRDSSTVTDAIDGVTLQLLNSFSEQETFKVNTDTTAVKTEIDEFIKSYNEVLTFLRDQAQFNADTKKRGPLADDFTYSSISTDLRNFALSEVTDITYGDYNLLYDIGIEADQQGRLSVKDSDKLTEAIETNSEFVSDIFNGSDGIATKINDYLENYVKTGGTISNSKKNLNDEISNINDRLELVKSLLKQKEEQLFNEFARLQETMYSLQSQQSFFGLFINNSG